MLLAAHRAGRRPGWLPWAALALGTAGSLAANVATAGPGTISRIIAGWPALALLIAVKLLTGMLNDPAITVPQPHAGQDSRDRPPRRAHHFAPLPTNPDQAVPATPGRLTPNRQVAPQRSAPGIADLLPAARTARDDLHRADRHLTRDARAARLRETGHSFRNSRLTPLLQTLRSETTTPPQTPPHPTRRAAQPTA